MNWYYQSCLRKEKTSFFMKKIKLTKNNTFNNVFGNKLFSFYRFLVIFKKWLDFDESSLIYLGKIFSTTLLYWESSFFESKKHFFDIRSKKKFLRIKESYVNSKKFSLIQWNRFVYIKENFFESTKLSFIQRNFFFDHRSKKLFSGCFQFWKKVKNL